MSALKFLMKYLEVPDNHFGRPILGMLTNIGHVYVGNLAPTFLIWCAYKFGAGYPVEWAMSTACILFYLCVWEIGIQKGWRGWDTVKDTFFFACGVMPYYFLNMSDISQLSENLKDLISPKYHFLAEFASSWRIIDVIMSIHLIVILFLTVDFVIQYRRRRNVGP